MGKFLVGFLDRILVGGRRRTQQKQKLGPSARTLASTTTSGDDQCENGSLTAGQPHDRNNLHLILRF